MFPFRDISPAALTFDYGPSGHINLDVRAMLGTLNFQFEEQVAPVQEEEYGDLHVDAVLKGALTSIDIPITRIDIDDWNAIFPKTTMKQSGNELVFSSLVGQAMFAESKNIMIRPIVNNVISVDRTEWIYIYHAYPVNVWTLGYDRENQRIINVHFEIFPIQGGVNRGRTHQIGY